MCILCVISRWSRRVVTMLPWLIVPFIIIWALSQLLPTGFRLEVTSPRLACLAVLLSSLGWYELLLPWLSSWRARRSALLRERKRIDAQEAAKWRKEATRRCRNCLTAYKVQNPGGGKFMCTYCGHISKRPVLEVPGAFPHSGKAGTSTYPGTQLVNGAGVPYFRGPWRGSRVQVGSWPQAADRGGCAWFGTPWPVGGGCLYSGEGGLHGSRSSLGESTHGKENCRAGQSFPGALSFVLRIFFSIWRKLAGVGKPAKDLSADGCKGSQGRVDELDSFCGVRSERGRRKAKEKRQARAEKEHLEAEERKQREEVARLVEERRRQREEQLELEKESEREVAAEREREMRRVKEIERRRKDKAKERVTEPVKDGPSEQEPKDTVMKSKTSVELDGRRANPVCTKVNGVDIGKNEKVFRGLVRDQGLRIRGATDNLMRWSSPRHGRTAKMGPFSKGAFPTKGGWGRSMAEDAHVKGKAPKSAVLTPPGTLNISLNSDEMSPSSGFSWKRVPWTNVWAKRTSTGESTSTHAEIFGGSAQRLDKNEEDGLNFLSNKPPVAKPSLLPVGATGIQPPIAPPSTHVQSLHQLFSSPSIFSPMDLSVDFQNQHDRNPQTDMKSSFLPEHTFFETPACVSFQPAESFEPLIMSHSPQTPILGKTSSLSPLQPPLNSSQSRNELFHMDAPQSSLSRDPVSELGTVRAGGIVCDHVSPGSLSVPDTVIIDSLRASPILKPTKDDGSEVYSDKDNGLNWDLSSVSLEDQNETVGGGRWQICDAPQLYEVKVSESSTWMPPFDPEALGLQGPSDSQHKDEISKLSSDVIQGMAQVSNRQSFWSDISAFNTAMRIWDDSDIHPKMPPEFVDCITQEIMEEPVITADGHSYERSAIEKWLKLHDTSPKTGEVLPPPPNGIGVDKTLRPNHILRGQIIEYKERLARMSELRAVSWSMASKGGGGFLKTPGTPSVLSF